METKTTATEPGIVRAGEWAHVRWGGHHLVVADEPEVDVAQPIRTACGQRFERFRIWHDAPKPWLPECKTCERSKANRTADTFDPDNCTGVQGNLVTWVHNETTPA